MRREDELVIKQLHKDNPELLREYLKQPFLVLDHLKNTATLPIPDDYTVQDLLNLFPFNSFLFLAEHQRGDYILDGPYDYDMVYWIKVEGEQVLDAPYEHLRFSAIAFQVVQMADRKDERIGVVMQPFDTKNGAEAKVYYMDGKPIERRFMETLPPTAAEEILRNIAWTFRAFYTIQEQDLYPVEERGKVTHLKQGFGSKKPWTREDLPRILFLNKLPAERDPTPYQPTGRHVTPHARRGHWRNLRHERYKNHPKFGSRIRVRPTWIGPEVADYQGRTYKLIKENHA